MTAEPYIRNSRILGVLDEILHGPQGSLSAVEIAGRGIAAEARCTLSVLDDKMVPHVRPPDEGLANAGAHLDRLIDLISIGDDLYSLWQCRQAGDIDDQPFEEELNVIVARLEAWPQAG